MKEIISKKKEISNFDKVVKNPGFILIIIFGIGLSIRLYYVPFELPLSLDSLTYFWYAMDMSILGEFPKDYRIPNNLWPSFLSIFFSIFNSENFMDYMNLQRLVSVVISILSVFPIYFLCKKFVSSNVALIGAALFAFEPRLIQNSTLGITEPLFLLLGVLTLMLFLSKDQKLINLSFISAALFALVRYEGLLIIIPLSIMFFIRFWKTKNVIPKYLLALIIFILILSPIVYVRMLTINDDGLVSHVVAGPQYFQHRIQVSENGQEELSNFIVTGILNFMKFFGWVMIPSFIMFVPVGIFLLFKNSNYEKKTMIIFAIVLSLPAFYAYSRDIQDTRYFFSLFPIFTILAVLAIEKFHTRIYYKKIAIGIICFTIFISSMIFLQYKEFDHNSENEVLDISKIVVKNVKVINDYYPQTKYLDSAILYDVEFPILRSEGPNDVKIIITDDYESLEMFVTYGKEKNLSHIVVDNQSNRKEFLRDVFDNEQKYPYLTKIYDSKEFGYNYHLKIFEINYEKFNNLRSN